MCLTFEQIVRRLAEAGISSPRMEARMLMESVASEKLEKLVELRCAHHPLDKLLGKRDFYKTTFKVTEDVLSPRPDTETLVEAAIAVIAKNNFTSLLDLGTGSGCILLSILGDCEKVHGWGVDKSAKALEIAQYNAKNLNLSDRVDFIEGSWFDKNFVENLPHQFDVIVSNPPYIPSKEIETLDEEVRAHDPLSALDGGMDGYEHYRQIAEVAPCILKDNGYIFLEAGIGQAQEIMRIFAQNSLQPVDIIKDLSAVERCVILKK